MSLDDTDNDSEASESESSLNNPKEDPALVTECAQLSLIISEAIASMLKLSFVFQKSSQRAKFARSSREKPYDTRFDILHVQEIFPYAASNSALVEKLGKANAQRRQWLSYRRRHHEKLSSKTNSTGGYTSSLRGHLSSDIYSESDEWTNIASIVTFSSRGPQDSVTADNSTVATTFYDESPLRRHEENREEGASETSYSASSVSGFDKEPILIPQPPLEIADGKSFECPFCFLILRVESLQTWM